MRSRNHNGTDIEQVTEFILIGFQLSRSLEIFVFALLLVVFLLTLAGNFTIILLVGFNQCFHTPMYFFLCNLSLLEVLFVSSITPKMLVTLMSRNKAISFLACAAQCYFYFFLGTTEFILIALMSFDRYVAICHPLCYATIMNGCFCICLVLFCWVGGLLSTIVSFRLIFRLSFCNSNIIDHFFCDYGPMITLSCNDVHVLLSLASILSSVVLLSSLSITAISYLYIIVTIFRTKATKGQQKACSTCASHIMVASIFYGSAIFMYSLSNKECSQDIQKAVAVLTAVVTPLLNPFIYTLRYEKVKETVKDFSKRKKIPL